MRRTPARRLLTRLLLGTLIPTLLALGAFGFLAHEVARRVLEDELGRRLALAAAATAGMILPEQMVALAAEDGESLTLENVRRKLATARERFDVRRVLLVSVKPDGPEFVARVDTEARIAAGAVAYELGADRLEVARAADGHPTASPLFIGHDQLAYKRGYSAIRGDAAVLGFAVVEANADYLVPLAAFRMRLWLAGAAALAAVVGITILMARRVSQPVVRLAVAAERIGHGNLDSPVLVETKDEVGLLAETIEQMRVALKARDERMQMMLAGIAHEVRNPLGGLELYAGLLRDSLRDQPDRLDEVRRIEREVHYLKRVVAEFLDYARRPTPEFTAVEIGALLDEVKELISDSAVRVEVESEAGVRVRADPGQLRRALLNLARNAVAAVQRTHADGGGMVRMRAHRLGQRLRVAVEDNGAGVAPELREKIFTPFFTTREKGTGLGLAFAREIVADHGGDLRVEPGAGGGARFFFELELASPGSA